MFDYHRRDLGGRIEADQGAGVAQRGRQDIASRLIPTRSGKEEHVGGIEVLAVGEQRRLAALSPCTAILRIEGQSVDDFPVDAVALADDDLAFRRKELCRRRHRKPIGIAEGSAFCPFDRLGQDDGDPGGDRHSHETRQGADDGNEIQIGEHLVPCDDAAFHRWDEAAIFAQGAKSGDEEKAQEAGHGDRPPAMQRQRPNGQKSCERPEQERRHGCRSQEPIFGPAG